MTHQLGRRIQFLCFLDESGVSEILKKVKPTERPTGGRPEINRYDLFATILYGFAFGSGTLRDLEDACKYDLRYIYLMRNEQPSHTVFKRLYSAKYRRNILLSDESDSGDMQAGL